MSKHRPVLQSLPFAVLRTPLLPIDVLVGWADGLFRDDPSSSGPGLSYERDLAVARNRLRQLVLQPDVRNALFLASPEFEAELEAWQEGRDSVQGLKVERTLVRYLSRMASRATPFGLFAGVSLLKIAPGSVWKVKLGPIGEHRRKSRLDMDYVFGLAATLSALPELAELLRFHPNTTLAPRGKWLTLIATEHRERTRNNQLIAVDGDELLEEVLRAAKGGATRAVLVDVVLAQSPDESRAEAQAFIDLMIEKQLLVSELEPGLTGPGALDALIADLEKMPPASEATAILRHCQAALVSIDAERGVPLAHKYRQVAESLAPLPSEVSLPRLFQVDLVKPMLESEVGRRIVDEVHDAVIALHSLSPAREPAAMSDFRRAFIERFDQRRVPLLAALDEVVGIPFEPMSRPGHRGPLLQDLPLPGLPREPVRREALIERHLTGRLIEVLQSGASELVLTPEDLEAMKVKDAPPLLSSFLTCASVSASSGEEVAAGRYELLVDDVPWGPPAARVVARFAPALPELLPWLHELCAREQALEPETLFAEVVYLPEDRAGNVLMRPQLHPYEIPLLARSDASPEHQLALQELSLFVADGRLVLWSDVLDREVKPVTSHAFSVDRGLSLHRFLAALQIQHQSPSMPWSWRGLAGQPFLPRVRLGRTVLARAQWNLSLAVLEPFTRAGSDRERFVQLQALKGRLKLPRWVEVEATAVDLDNPLSALSLLPTSSRSSPLQLLEVFPEAAKQAVEGPEGRFRHELLVPFVRTERSGTKAVAPPVSRHPRSFPPGSEWLYVKLYTARELGDEVLDQCVRPVVERALAEGSASGWFFIRYEDPLPHLRVRFRGSAARLLAETLPHLHTLCEPFLQTGVLHKLQVDTYEREVERYGGDDGMALAEALFQLDSELCLGVVSLALKEEAVEDRWRFTLGALDALMRDFGLTLKEGETLSREMREGYAFEFGAGGPMTTALSRRFRTERAGLTQMLERARGGSGAPEWELLAATSAKVVPLARDLCALIQAGLLPLKKSSLLSDLLHMRAIRLLPEAPREHELVLHDFLERLQGSERARTERAPQ